MAKLDILLAPDPVLKTRCKPVAAIDDEVRRLMDDMLETMYDAPGIGLAAPQVGVSRRVIVADVDFRKEEPGSANPLRMVNPEVTWTSEEESTYEEGCLSLPTHYADVTRPARCRVRYTDEAGETREIEADGLLATCLQHEIDHINGILFVDHLSALKRNMILKKMVKAKKQKKDEAA
jgi:peptide deformylase